MFCIPRNNERINPITAGLFEPFEVGGQNCPCPSPPPLSPPPHLYINMCLRKARVMKFSSYIHHHVCFQNIHKDYC